MSIRSTFLHATPCQITSLPLLSFSPVLFHEVKHSKQARAIVRVSCRKLEQAMPPSLSAANSLRSQVMAFKDWCCPFPL